MCKNSFLLITRYVGACKYIKKKNRIKINRRYSVFLTITLDF